MKPERARNNNRQRREIWWRFTRPALDLYEAIADLDRVLVVALVSRTVMPVMVPTGQVFSHMLGVFNTEDPGQVALLSSGVHYAWAIARASSLKGDLRYTPSDVYETLPLPELTSDSDLPVLGLALDEARAQLMIERGLGLTKLYNAVHDRSVIDEDIQHLRDLHEQIDQAVAGAYGWTGLDLRHGFYEMRQGLRHTLSPATQVEALDHLLELNHSRHASDEVNIVIDVSRNQLSEKRSKIANDCMNDTLF